MIDLIGNAKTMSEMYLTQRSGNKTFPHVLFVMKLTFGIMVSTGGIRM